MHGGYKKPRAGIHRIHLSRDVRVCLQFVLRYLGRKHRARQRREVRAVTLASRHTLRLNAVLHSAIKPRLSIFLPSGKNCLVIFSFPFSLFFFFFLSFPFSFWFGLTCSGKTPLFPPPPFFPASFYLLDLLSLFSLFFTFCLSSFV